MAKKTPRIDTERLDAIEKRLSQMEAVVRHFAYLAVPAGVWWSHPFLLRQAFPALTQSAGVSLPSEIKEMRREMRETPVEPWKHLVRRAHPWRKQLYVRGRNLTARQLVGGIKANKFNEEQATANYQLPGEAIREALAYVEKNEELLKTEAEIERLMLKREGVARGPQPVSG